MTAPAPLMRGPPPVRDVAPPELDPDEPDDPEDDEPDDDEPEELDDPPRDVALPLDEEPEGGFRPWSALHVIGDGGGDGAGWEAGTAVPTSPEEPEDEGPEAPGRAVASPVVVEPGGGVRP